MYIFVYEVIELSLLLHPLSVCVCVCVCIHVNFLSFLLFLTSPKELKEFRVFLLTIESASSSKLNFVPTGKKIC